MDQLAAALPKEQLPAFEELNLFLDKFQKKQFKPNQLNGYRFPGGFYPDNIRYVNEEWDMPENAVFVASFPRTGNNWTGEIVRQILYSRDEKLDKLTKPVSLLLSRLTMGPVSKFKMFDSLPLPRRFFNSTLPEELFNFQKMKKKKGKMIYVIRNPKDQAVSWYQFIKNAPLPSDLKTVVNAGWDSYYNIFLQGKLSMFSKPGEGYPEHIRGWLKHKDDKDFLLLVYEEMKEDLPKQVRRIAEFVDVKLTDDEVNQIADKCLFSSMKKSLQDDVLDVRRAVARKGEVGEWKDYFTVAQSERMDRIMEEKLGDTGIQFIYTL